MTGAVSPGELSVVLCCVVLCCGAYYLWLFSVELASYHPSSAKNFEAVSRLLKTPCSDML